MLLFNRNDLTFEKAQWTEKAGLEILTNRSQTSKTQWFHLCNVYLPNTGTQVTRFDPSVINVTPNSIIIRDFKENFYLWDPIQPPDARGNELEDWIYDLNLHVLIDGSPSRTTHITGNNISHDLSMSGRTWKTEEPIGDSKHLLVQIDIHLSIRYQPVLLHKKNGKGMELICRMLANLLTNKWRISRQNQTYQSA